MAIDYTRDFVAFMRDLFPVEGAYGPRAVIPPFLESWLYRAFPLPEGNPAARNVLDARTKKQGKSATAGAVAAYMATRQTYAEVVIAAADQDQAKDRVLRAVKFAFENGPLGKYARVYRDVIELDNGSIIQAVPMDWRGSAGGNYAAVIFDELHTYTLEQHRRIFDELIIPPTQPYGVRWIASYAGYEGESVLLKEQWDKALTGERIDSELPIYHNAGASLLAMIDTGEASWRMPWTMGEAGQRYMAEQRANERPNTFCRLWLNEWVSSESQFVTEGQWAACYSPELKPLAEGDGRRIVLGADAGTTRDLTALVGCAFNPTTGAVEVAFCKVWKPTKGALRKGKPTVDLDATIGAEILKLHKAGVVEGVYYDPYQLHSIAVNLEKERVKMIELPQTTGRIAADAGLFDAIIGRTLVHYGDAILTEHVLAAVALETSRGLRLAKEKTSRKIDAAVALSMGHYGALELLKARAAATLTIKPSNPFYSRALGDYVPIPPGLEWNTPPKVHPPGVDWRTCRHRMRGCPACINELRREGLRR